MAEKIFEVLIRKLIVSFEVTALTSATYFYFQENSFDFEQLAETVFLD